MLCKSIEEVNVAVDYTTPRAESQDIPGTSEERPNTLPVPVTLIRTQMLGEVLYLGTPEFNDVANNIGQITIDFSLMQIDELYALHNVAIIEMKVRMGTLIKQAKFTNKIVNKMKLEVQGTE